MQLDFFEGCTLGRSETIERVNQHVFIENRKLSKKRCGNGKEKMFFMRTNDNILVA